MDSDVATRAPPLKVWNSTCENWLAAQAALEKYYLSIFYGIEFILGMLGNVTVLFGYLFCLKSWNSSNIYLFNLSISDLAFLCTLPVLTSSYATEQWQHGDVLCVSNRFALHANLYTSILFLTFVSMDRYLLIKYPFREHLLQKKGFAVFVSLAIWVLVTVELLPILPLISPVVTNQSTNCMDFASSGDPRYNLAYSLCLTLVGFVLPLAAMCFFYCKMAALLPAAPSRHRPRRLVLLAVATFSALFTPYHVMRNVSVASRLRAAPLRGCAHAAVRALYVVTRPVAFLNSVVNPVFYFLVGDRFREMLASKLRRLRTSLAPCRG